MANQEHLDILKQGVEVWNKWRHEHIHVIPELSGANLWGANLYIAKLNRANLRGALLVQANLSGADLSEANLSEAVLRGANLGQANLSKTNFAGAELWRANLSGAKLKNANLINAGVGETIFTNVNLSVVFGLESLNHLGRSFVGIDTIYRSKGNIPEVFLRGCGLPDEFIEYIPSLIGKGIEYYSCFISYSHRDDDFAKRLHNDLQAKGVRCWFAPHDMKIGDKIRHTIDDSIRLHDKLLLILSEHSVQSDWVEHEVEHALDLERERKKTGLFPVRIDDAIMESKTGWAGNVKRQRHIGDFTQWKQHDAYQAAFDRLLRDLKA